MSIEVMSQRMTALQDIEARMGEMAALLSEMANALTYYPDAVLIGGVTNALPPSAKMRIDAIRIRAREWPSIEEIQALLAEWHTEMIEVRRAWEGLPSQSALKQAPERRKNSPMPIRDCCFKRASAVTCLKVARIAFPLGSRCPT